MITHLEALSMTIKESNVRTQVGKTTHEYKYTGLATVFGANKTAVLLERFGFNRRIVVDFDEFVNNWELFKP